MEENALFMGNTGNVRNRLNRADLVVSVHHGNQNGLWSNRTLHIVRIHATVSIHRQVRHRGAKPFKKPTRIDDSRMFNLRRDDVSATSLFGKENALQRMIVGFASP